MPTALHGPGMDTTMIRLLVIASLVLLLVIGTYWVFFPARVQQWAVRSFSMSPTAKIPFVKNFMESRSYLFMVRLGGLIFYVVFVLLAVAAYRGPGE
jgi:hypothetical protein